MVRDVSTTTFQKWAELLLRLRDATRRGSIHWSATADNDCFVASFKAAVILFGSRVSGYDEIDYFIELKNTAGDTVDEFTDVDLDRGRSIKDAFRQMKEMHADITRNLSGADAILNSILEELPPAKDEIPF